MILSSCASGRRSRNGGGTYWDVYGRGGPSPGRQHLVEIHGRHPARPPLVVEATLTRLAFDREYKSSLYARAAIVDYWIVNLCSRWGVAR